MGDTLACCQQDALPGAPGASEQENLTCCLKAFGPQPAWPTEPGSVLVTGLRLTGRERSGLRRDWASRSLSRGLSAGSSLVLVPAGPGVGCVLSRTASVTWAELFSHFLKEVPIYSYTLLSSPGLKFPVKP